MVTSATLATGKRVAILHASEGKYRLKFHQFKGSHACFLQKGAENPQLADIGLPPS
ncbi:MAG: hypothetical protein HQL49_10115 [Gammaproteobacteria bacterium]|nr:hypothetical protein [Gammaproteobacteria bacterium]